MTHQTDSMTVTQAARKLGVHRRTVDRLVARGRLSRNQLTGCIAAAQIEDVKVERFNQQEREYQISRETLIFRIMTAAMENLGLPFKHEDWLINPLDAFLNPPVPHDRDLPF
jgi:IS30 family transposase